MFFGGSSVTIYSYIAYCRMTWGPRKLNVWACTYYIASCMAYVCMTRELELIIILANADILKNSYIKYWHIEGYLWYTLMRYHACMCRHTGGYTYNRVILSRGFLGFPETLSTLACPSINPSVYNIETA